VFCYSNGEPEDDETTIAEYIENTEEDSDAAKAKPAAKEVKAEEQESVAESPSKETENVASAKGETAKATESPKKDGSSEKQTTPPSASEKQISAPSTDDKRTDISSFTIYVTESPEEGEDGGDDDEPEHDLGEVSCLFIRRTKIANVRSAWVCPRRRRRHSKQPILISKKFPNKMKAWMRIRSLLLHEAEDRISADKQ
jgi:hypothetical protein